MQLQYTPHFTVLCVTAFISAALAFASWKRQSTAAQTYFTLLMVAVTGYASVAGLEAAAIALPQKIFWSTLEYVGSNSTITLFLFFTAHFTQQRNWLSCRNTALLWVIPILNVLLVATNHWHHLVWTDFLPGPTGSNQIVYQHGPGFFWVMVWVYLYTLSGTLLLARAALRASALHRNQAGTVLIGSLIPLLGSSAYMLNLTPPGLNITPMCFMLAGLVFSVSLFQFRLFDLIPVARDLLVESMSDGLLVLDVQHRIVDINPAAKRLIGKPGGYLGKHADTVLAEWVDIAQICRNDENAHIEVLLHLSQLRYVDLQVSPLQDWRGRLTGWLVVLHDITSRYEIELELRQANHRLQRQLKAIELLQAKLREQAIRDDLTGVFNRRYFEETIMRELACADREGYSIALLLLDIDFFKKINDSYGHQAGDLVLQTFANLLMRHSRLGDLVCRLGGEEFVLVLLGMTLTQAYERAEQIRLAFQASSVAWEGVTIHATVSGGLAIFPVHGMNSYELLQVADRGLYAAKAAGRNQIQLPDLSRGVGE